MLLLRFPPRGDIFHLVVMDIFRRFLLRPLLAVEAGLGGVARPFHLFLCKGFHGVGMEISRRFLFWPLFPLSGVLPPPLPMCFILLLLQFPLICCQRSPPEVNTHPPCKLSHTLRTNEKSKSVQNIRAGAHYGALPEGAATSNPRLDHLVK